MWDLAVRLVGELVILEPLAREHADDLYAAARPAEIWTWWPVNPGADDASFHDWFDGALAAPRAGTGAHFATVDAATGRAIGSTSFCTPRPQHRGVEIGWTWLAPSRWRTGANAEAKALQLRYAFEELDCVRVEFETDEHNERSRRALEALPARFEGVLRDWTILPDGRRRSSAFYSVLEREWPDVSSRLATRVRAAAAAGLPDAVSGGTGRTGG